MRKLLLALLLVPAVASASGYSITNYVPRDMAMGDSLVADQTGAGAVYRNPAALARLSGLNLNLTGALIGNGTTWTNTTTYFPSPVSTDLKLVPPVALFASWSGKIADHGYGVGVGMNLPGGGNVYWPDGWAGRYAIQTVDRKFYGFYAVAGVEIIPQIRVGGGFIYYYTTEKLTTYVPVPGPVGATDALATIADSGGQPSFSVALEVQPVLDFPLRIGVNYSQQAYQKLTGTLNVAVPPPLAPTFPNQAVTHVLPYPSVLGVGVSWRIIPELVLTLQYTWEGYAAYTSDTFVGQTTNPSTGQPLTVTVQRQYRNSSLYRIGAGYQLLQSLELRGGLFYDDSGMNPAYFNPSLPDAKKVVATLGAGWEVVKNLSIEGAFLYSWFLPFDSVPAPSTATLDNASSFPGQFKGWAWIASLGVNWKWDPQASKQASAN
jgi:long-chain fatty acid transport protein